MAPSSPSIWSGQDASLWLAFKNVRGLNVEGSGIIFGQGKEWWDQSCRYHPQLVYIILSKLMNFDPQHFLFFFLIICANMSVIFLQEGCTKLAPTVSSNFVTYRRSSNKNPARIKS